MYGETVDFPTRKNSQTNSSNVYIYADIKLFAYWEILHAFVVCYFFFKITFLKNSVMNTIRVSNGFDPVQARHLVGPDLGSNRLQKLSADDTSRQRF